MDLKLIFFLYIINIMSAQDKPSSLQCNSSIYKMFKKWSNIINETKLVRTDSTTLGFIPKNNLGMGGYIGSVLTPLGRKRRIHRLNKEFIKEFLEEFKTYKESKKHL